MSYLVRNYKTFVMAIKICSSNFPSKAAAVRRVAGRQSAAAASSHLSQHSARGHPLIGCSITIQHCKDPRARLLPPVMGLL